MCSLIEDKLIVALDVSDLGQAHKLVQQLYPAVKIFKVGSQLFTSCGPDIIEAIQKEGAEVFLDLKFHDIPNAVSGAIQSATELCVFMLTVHTWGGPDMLKQAAKSAEIRSGKLGVRRPKILGVTVLTSMDDRDLKKIGINKSSKEAAVYLAGLAKRQGLDGVVASPEEVSYIRKALGRKFIIVTPGIRPKGSVERDQKRIATPKDAIQRGADYIVVGRPIIEAQNPRVAAEDILKEIEDAEKRRGS